MKSNHQCAHRRENASVISRNNLNFEKKKQIGLFVLAIIMIFPFLFGCMDLSAMLESVYSVDNSDPLEAGNQNNEISQSEMMSKEENTVPETTINEDALLPSSEGLAYKFSDDKKGFIVTGIGTCEDSEVVIPYYYNDLPVIAISEKAFSKADADRKTVQLTKVRIPSSVVEIGEGAFFECKHLKEVVIGNGVKIIGKAAFRRCFLLEQLTFGESLSSIGEGAFSECNKIEIVEMPEKVQIIGDYAFFDCKKIKKVVMGENVKSVGQRAFAKEPELSEIVIGSTSCSYGASAIDLKSLTSIKYSGTSSGLIKIIDAITGNFKQSLEYKYQFSSQYQSQMASFGVNRYYKVGKVSVACQDKEIILCIVTSAISNKSQGSSYTEAAKQFASALGYGYYDTAEDTAFIDYFDFPAEEKDRTMITYIQKLYGSSASLKWR